MVVDPAVLQELSDPKRYPVKVQLQLLRKIPLLSVEPRPQDRKRLEDSIYQRFARPLAIRHGQLDTWGRPVL